MHTDKIERRAFSVEEKQEILRRTKCKCAHCGKKLNVNTMTIEHIYPLNKGGDHSEYNLIALCSECNNLKSNYIYDIDFFSHIIDSEIAKYEYVLNEFTYKNSNDKNIFGSYIKTIHYLSDYVRYKLGMYRGGRPKFSARQIKAISKKLEYRVMYEGDITEEVTELLREHFTAEEQDITTYVNKYALINITKNNTLYGLYDNNKLIGITLYMNIDNLVIQTDLNNMFRDACKDYDKVYVKIFSSINKKYGDEVEKGILETEIRYMAHTNNLIVEIANKSEGIFESLMHDIPAINVHLKKEDCLLEFESNGKRDNISDGSRAFTVVLGVQYESFKECVEAIKEVNNEIKESIENKTKFKDRAALELIKVD